MGLWQTALQKPGVSCHTQNPMPATTNTSATVPTTMGHFFGFMATTYARSTWHRPDLNGG